MKAASAAASYQTARIENAPPLRLVHMLYEGALRFLEQAQAAHGAGELLRFQERCLRAQAIVAELRSALDPGQAPELAEQLTQLYLFAEGEIRRASLAESSEPLGPVREMLSTLLDGWKHLEVGP